MTLRRAGNRPQCDKRLLGRHRLVLLPPQPPRQRAVYDQRSLASDVCFISYDVCDSAGSPALAVAILGLESLAMSDKHENLRKWITLGIEVVGLAGLLVYACVTYEMWGEMHAQTVNSTRAWVGLDGPIQLDALETLPRLLVESHYTIRNFGHGPALKVMQSGWFETNPKLSDATANFACDSAVAFATGTVPHGPDVTLPGPIGYSLFPNQSHAGAIGSPGNPWQGEAQPSMSHFWLIGCVAYLDQFRTVHWTRFCMEPEIGQRTMNKDVPLAFCARYNDTDETQEKQKAPR